MKCFLALRRREVLSLVAQMNLVNTVLCGRSQEQKCYMISFVCGIMESETLGRGE
jgi:hypothetical protein